MADGDVFGITGFGVTGFGMMASAMFGAEPGDAHAVLAADGMTGAEHGAELGDAPALFEAADRTSEVHAVELVDALAILEFAGGHAGDIASAPPPLASSAGVESCKKVAAVASKSGG